MMRRSNARAQRPVGALFEGLEARAMMAGSTFVDFNTNYGKITLQLDDDTAPITVTNFLTYVNAGRYDNTFFHRRNAASESYHILQGGGFKLAPLGGSVTTNAPIVLENTGRTNKINTIAMARSNGNDTATSQFFFNVTDNFVWDQPGTKYAAFGEIVAGADVIQTINTLRVFNLSGGNTNSPFTTVPVRDAYNASGSAPVDAPDLAQLVSATASTAADLRVTNFTAGANIRPGDTLNVTWTVKNFGKTAATQAWTDRIIISKNSIVGDADDLTMGDFTVSGSTLAGGASLDREANVTVPLDVSLAPGSYSIFVISDVGNVVPEALESNNSTAASTTTVATSALALSGTPQGAAASSTNENLVATINAAGRAVVFSQVTTGGNTKWVITDIQAQSGSPAPRREIELWFDPIDGLAYGASPSASGLILYTRAANGTWSFRNLTTELSGAIINTEITVFQSTDKLVHVAGLTSGGELVIFKQNRSGASPVWEFRNLTTQDLTPNGFQTPAFVGEITSYVTSWNAMNIVGLDAQGKVQTVWVQPPTFTVWRTDNLIPGSSAPTLSGGLTIFQTPWSAINIIGVDTNNQVFTTWFLNGTTNYENGAPTNNPAKQWWSSNLTVAYNFPALFGGRLTSYVQPWGGQNVVGRTEDGNIAIYWWSDGVNGNNWNYSSSFVTTDLRPSGRFTGVSSPTGSTTIVTTTSTSRVYRYYWSPPSASTPWIAEDITASALS